MKDLTYPHFQNDLTEGFMQYTRNIKAFPFEGTGLDRGRVAGFGVEAVIGGIRAA